MDTSDLLRHELIKGLTTQRHEKGTDAAVDLWTQMAERLILIIGTSGFDSLYARSVFLSQTTYPWLAAGLGPPRPITGLPNWKEAFKNSRRRLRERQIVWCWSTFTNILVSMIGERLTTRILDSAWGIASQETADKEVKNA